MLFGTGTRKLKKQPNRNTKATAQQRPNYSRPPKGQKPKRRPKSPNKNNPKRPRLKIPQIMFPKLPKIGTRKRPKYLKSKRPVKQRPNHQTVILLTDPTQSTPTGSKYQSSPTLAPPLPPPEPYINQANTSQTTLNPINSAAAKFEMDRFRWLAEMRKLFKDSYEEKIESD